MNRLKLKETMDQIHMKEEMQKEIIMKVKRQTDRRAFGKKDYIRQLRQLPLLY